MHGLQQQELITLKGLKQVEQYICEFLTPNLGWLTWDGVSPILGRKCCLFGPAFGCCALQMLVQIFIFNVFCEEKAYTCLILNSLPHPNKYNLQLSMLSHLIIWEIIKRRFYGNGSRTVQIYFPLKEGLLCLRQATPNWQSEIKIHTTGCVKTTLNQRFFSPRMSCKLCSIFS